MRKIETIWHYLLNSALTEKKYKHTQQELAGRLGLSLSTVNHALKGPTRIGAIRKASKFFVLVDFPKLLYFWASFRNLEKDIIYRTRVEGTTSETEGLVPPDAILAAYSAAKKILVEPSADYSKVYFYLSRENLPEAQRRFLPSKNRNEEPNVFILSTPPSTWPTETGATSLPQTFVDLWNLKDWYAKEFTKALEEKMYGILS